jgi:transcriptional regulator GlxA family with amidase domain
MYRITILCSNHCLSSSITSFIDAFQIANEVSAERESNFQRTYAWTLASPEGRDVVTSTGILLK